MKAVVLAAGEGTRLEPLTNVRPKPMLPVANRPILEHVVEALTDAGIEEIVLVVGYRRQRIQNHFRDGDAWGVDITYVVQEPQLGSGHALLQAESVVGEDVVVLNGDQIVDSTAIESAVAERERTGDAVVVASRTAETHLYGVVDVEDGRAVDLVEKPVAATTESDLVNAGVYAFGPEIFAALRNTDTEGELGLPTALRQHLPDHPVRVVTYDGPWFDVTRPWDLLTANAHLLDQGDYTETPEATVHETATVVGGTILGEGTTVRPNATVLRNSAIGDNVTVGANAVVENAILMDDVTVGPSTTIRDCIVGANATVGTGTIVEGGRADVVLEETVHRDVLFGGIVGDNADLGGHVTVTPGTRLGNGSTVESSCVLEDQYEPGSTVCRG